jgi:hypothetical protein
VYLIFWPSLLRPFLTFHTLTTNRCAVGDVTAVEVSCRILDCMMANAAKYCDGFLPLHGIRNIVEYIDVLGGGGCKGGKCQYFSI